MSTFLANQRQMRSHQLLDSYTVPWKKTYKALYTNQQLRIFCEAQLDFLNRQQLLFPPT